MPITSVTLLLGCPSRLWGGGGVRVQFSTLYTLTLLSGRVSQNSLSDHCYAKNDGLAIFYQISPYSFSDLKVIDNSQSIFLMTYNIEYLTIIKLF